MLQWSKRRVSNLSVRAEACLLSFLAAGEGVIGTPLVTASHNTKKSLERSIMNRQSSQTYLTCLLCASRSLEHEKCGINVGSVHSAEQAATEQPGVAITRTFRQKTRVCKCLSGLGALPDLFAVVQGLQGKLTALS
jgi:hypothetical protein